MAENVKIKVINQSGYPMPQYATTGAAGLDIRAAIADVLSLASLERALVPTGLFFEIPVGFEAQVRPRSGLAIHNGITCLNAPGTIDADYRGEVKVILINLSNTAQTIEPGQRIAQLVIQPVTKALLVEVAALSESDRGQGGFGSTGNT